MTDRDDSEILEFFGTRRTEAVKSRIRPTRKGKQSPSPPLRLASTSTSTSRPKRTKPDLFVACSGDAIPLDDKQRQQLLNNFHSYDIWSLHQFLASRTVNQVLEQPPPEVEGPYFYATVRADSSTASAQKLYSTLGNWDDNKSRDAALRDVAREVAAQTSSPFFESEKRAVTHRVEFLQTPNSQKIRIAAQCLGKPTSYSFTGAAQYQGDGIRWQDIEKEEINEMYWVKSITEEKVRRFDSKGQERISFSYTFCLEDQTDIDAGESSEGESGMQFTFKRRDAKIWINSTSDFATLRNVVPVAASLEMLERQIKEVIARQREMEESFKQKLAYLFQMQRETMQSMGIQGTLGAVQACYFSKASYDENGRPKPEAIAKCIENKIAKDITLNQIRAIQKLRSGLTPEAKAEDVARGYDLKWIDDLKTTSTPGEYVFASTAPNEKSAELAVRQILAASGETLETAINAKMGPGEDPKDWVTRILNHQEGMRSGRIKGEEAKDWNRT